MIRTRFAPSPTGMLHVGGLRTALFSYLFARKQSGTFCVRIEDTDQERFVEGGIENILRSIQWGGLAIAEGVTLDKDNNVTEIGDKGPYIQSKRLPTYKKYVEQLIDSGHAYYCFCTKERLDELRNIQEASKLPSGYDGHCRNLSEEDRKSKIQNKEPFVVRMKMPREGVTEFTDMVRGKVSFENKLIDDQVLLKSDGFPTYHLAVVVDDHFMEITHVIRGEEWLPSTPKHIMLYQMFGWEPPQFAHLALLVNEQKQKLSKRHGDVSVEDFKAKGYLPEAMVNFIAFLGWNPGDERELFTLAELEKEFDFERVSKAAAVFNREKLNWYNQQYIRKMDNGELLNACMPYLVNAGLIEESRMQNADFVDFLESAMGLVKDRLVTLADAPVAIGFLFADKLEYDSELLVWKKSDKVKTKEVLLQLAEFLTSIHTDEWTKELLDQKVGEWIKQNGFGVGDVLWPMRVSLSGEKNSPGPYEIAPVLGKEKTLKRLKSAYERLS